MLKNISKFKTYGKYAIGTVVVAIAVLIAVYLMPGKSILPESSHYLTKNSGGMPSVLSSREATAEYAPAPSESALSYGGSEYENDSSQSGQTAETERQVVKQGSLSLLVKKADETAEKIKSIAGDFKGFTDAVYIYNVSETSKSGTVTIRIPSDKFDEAMAKIKELAIRVEQEEVSATDVTAEFVDMEAWLINLKAEEQQYVRIMAEAKNVEDTLNVARYLSETRGAIERLQAQINYLSGRIEMSSITVSLTEEGDVELFGIHWRPLFTLKQAFRDMLSGLTGYADSMIGLILFLPTLILWLATFVAAFWLLRKLYKFIRRKFFAK